LLPVDHGKPTRIIDIAF